jgi:CubicO group peptidase (beta-lactamase class C family)
MLPSAVFLAVEGLAIQAADFALGGGTGRALGTRSLFHMASITKPFVATSIMQLAEKGKIDLDAPVVRYLPYFRMSDERYKIITMRQMATHTSRIPNVDDYESDKPQYDEGALRAVRPHE